MMVANNLRFLRQRDGYTQRFLANYLNIDRSTYTYYEVGKTEPKMVKLQALSQLFQVTIDELINCDMANDSRFVKRAESTPESDTELCEEQTE